MYFEFDPNGNTVAAVDPRGHATYYSYDEADRIRQVQTRSGDGVRGLKSYRPKV